MNEFIRPDTREIALPIAEEVRTLEEWVRGAEDRIAPLERKLLAQPLRQAMEFLAEYFPRVCPDRDVANRTEFIAIATSALTAMENRIEAIQQHLTVQEASLQFATSADARNRLILETSAVLGANRRQRRGDRRALRRWLDWPAMRERAENLLRRLRRTEQVVLRLLGLVLEEDRSGRLARSVVRTSFLDWTMEAFERPQPALLERELVATWRRIFTRTAEEESRPRRWKGLLKAMAKRAHLATGDVWVQAEALHAWLIADPKHAIPALRLRFRTADREPADNLFVRRHILDVMSADLPERRLREFIARALHESEPSAHVRQGAVLAAGRLTEARTARWIGQTIAPAMAREPVMEVRAALHRSLSRLYRVQPERKVILGHWLEHLDREKDSTAVGIGLRHLSDAFEDCMLDRAEDRSLVERIASLLVERGAERQWPLPVRRRAEELLARVRVAARPGFAAFRESVLPRLLHTPSGESVELIPDFPLTERDLGLFLAWAARESESLFASPTERGWRVQVGARRRFRWWRFWYETLRPAPDKRQAFNHLTGRTGRGKVRAHAVLLAEESPTKVPGEPRKIAREGGWRPFIPPVDDFLDALQEKEIHLYSAQGVALIVAPAETPRRRKIWQRLTHRYASYAKLREESWLGNPEHEATAYLDALRKLGFEIRWEGFLHPSVCTVTPYYTKVASPAADPGPKAADASPAREVVHETA